MSGMLSGFALAGALVDGLATGFFVDLARGLVVAFAAGFAIAPAAGFAGIGMPRMSCALVSDLLFAPAPWPIAACDESLADPGIARVSCICFIASSMLAPRSSVGVGHPVSRLTAGPPMFATPIICPIV